MDLRIPGCILVAGGGLLLLRRNRAHQVSEIPRTHEPLDSPAAGVSEASDALLAGAGVPLRRQQALYAPLLLLAAAVVLCSMQGAWQPVVFILAALPFIVLSRLGAPAPPPSERSQKPSLLALASQFEGTWIKDPVKSDSMEAALQLMQLNGLVRTAIRLVRGVKIRVTPDEFEFAVFSVISWFKVTEQYPWSGEAVSCKRRDLRSGTHRGFIHATHDGRLVLQLSWEEPLGGVGEDVFSLSRQGQLHISSTVQVGGVTASYTQVYQHRR